MDATVEQKTEQAADAWGQHYRLPPKGNMMGKDPRRFVEAGTALFHILEAAILKYKPNQPIEKMEILDFGCGVGRVAMPFFYKYKRPTACVDISSRAVEYLQEVLPGANPRRSRGEPPLPYFKDGQFDVIYSISVFTHLNLEKGDAWLKEIHRLLKPGGLALLSTSSHVRLEGHKVHAERAPLWQDVTVEKFEREGRIFRGEFNPMMKGEYGCTIHTPEWVKANWSKLFTVKETRVRELGDRQDLNILEKPL